MGHGRVLSYRAKGDPFSRGPRKVNVARFVGGLGLIVLAYVRSGIANRLWRLWEATFRWFFKRRQQTRRSLHSATHFAMLSTKLAIRVARLRPSRNGL